MPRARLTTIAALISAVAGAIAIMVSPIISNQLPLTITGAALVVCGVIALLAIE
jgi:uncharacterized membrane protein HdeD (DUF308 family)